MITRFVKLHFNEDFCNQFEKNFPYTKQKVESHKGCIEVKLFKAENNTYFTISKWERELDLNNYRESDFFKKTWSNFKANFSSKAFAWTTEEFT